jgi:hypothetical protein
MMIKAKTTTFSERSSKYFCRKRGAVWAILGGQESRPSNKFCNTKIQGFVTYQLINIKMLRSVVVL